MQIKNLKIRPIVPIVLLIMATFFFQPSPAGGASVVRTDKGIYNQGEMIGVNFTNAPGNDSDWICIVPAGSPDTDAGDYKYMPRGLGQGILIFNPRSPGKYEARAYYNYRRNGYVVSGRTLFSVAGDPARQEALAPPSEGIDPNYSPEANLPPPISFVAPPSVVVLPGTDVYLAPDVQVDLFFQGGWWWRQWRGNWYRSKYHDHGWAYYRSYPTWHRKVPHDWRHNYRSHVWGGRPWNPPQINHGNLHNHWRGGHWRNDHGWGRPGGGRDRPDPKGGGHDGRNLKGGGRDRPDPKGGGHDGRNLKGGGRDRPDPKGDGRDRPNPPDGQMNRSDVGGSHRGDRR